MTRASTTFPILVVVLFALVPHASVIKPAAIARLYQHIWEDQLESLPGDLVLGRKNMNARSNKTDVREFYVAIYSEIEPPDKLGPLEAMYVIADEKPLSAQLRDFEHQNLAEIDESRDRSVTYWPMSNDPILKLLHFRSGRLKEEECPALRKIVTTYAEYNPRVEPDLNPFESDERTGPWYYLRSSGASGELALYLDGSSVAADWIRTSLLQLEGCLATSGKSD